MHHVLRRLVVLAASAVAAGLVIIPGVSVAQSGATCVASTGGSRYDTLQVAIDHAAAGGTITIKGRCVSAAQLTIDKPLTVKGIATPATGTPTIDAALDGGLVSSASLTVADLLIRDASTAISMHEPDGITAPLTLTLRKVEITNSDQGINVTRVTVDIRDSRIHDNEFVAVGIFEAGGSIRGTEIWDNGSGIRTLLAFDGLDIRDSRIHHNGNGIISTDSGLVRLLGRTEIDHNSGRGASLDGGRLSLLGRSSIHHNDGAGVSGNTGYITCGERSSIRHNRDYGVRFGQRGGSLAGCVGRRLHDNVPDDLYLAPGTLVDIDGVIHDVPI